MDACYCLWDDSVFQSGPLCSNPRQSSWSAESVTASSIHHSGLVVGRCTPRLPGDRGNTCPALLGTSSSPPFLCLVLLGAQRRATENCESSTFVVVCCPYTKIRGKGEMVFPRLPHLPSPPLFLTQEEGTCTEWTAHHCHGSCTDHV